MRFIIRQTKKSDIRHDVGGIGRGYKTRPCLKSPPTTPPSQQTTSTPVTNEDFGDTSTQSFSIPSPPRLTKTLRAEPSFGSRLVGRWSLGTFLLRPRKTLSETKTTHTKTKSMAALLAIDQSTQIATVSAEKTATFTLTSATSVSQFHATTWAGSDFVGRMAQPSNRSLFEYVVEGSSSDDDDKINQPIELSGGSLTITDRPRSAPLQCKEPIQTSSSFRSTLDDLIEVSAAERDSTSAVGSDDVLLWYRTSPDHSDMPSLISIPQTVVPPHAETEVATSLPMSDFSIKQREIHLGSSLLPSSPLQVLHLEPFLVNESSNTASLFKGVASETGWIMSSSQDSLEFSRTSSNGTISTTTSRTIKSTTHAAQDVHAPTTTTPVLVEAYKNSDTIAPPHQVHNRKLVHMTPSTCIPPNQIPATIVHDATVLDKRLCVLSSSLEESLDNQNIPEVKSLPCARSRQNFIKISLALLLFVLAWFGWKLSNPCPLEGHMTIFDFDEIRDIFSFRPKELLLLGSKKGTDPHATTLDKSSFDTIVERDDLDSQCSCCCHLRYSFPNPSREEFRRTNDPQFLTERNNSERSPPSIILTTTSSILRKPSYFWTPLAVWDTHQEDTKATHRFCSSVFPLLSLRCLTRWRRNIHCFVQCLLST